jgi:ubiquinol-cytochrome c reductase iron-sulfur subunit
LLTAITSGVGALGALFAAIPFVRSMLPSERARALGAPVEADISRLGEGELMTVEWRGQPIWILKRTAEMLDSLKRDHALLADPDSRVDDQQPKYAKNETRSIKPDVLVLIGICTHLGCSPDKRLSSGVASGLGQEWPGGFFCPCHGSKFDLAGRVFRNVPAPTNLKVPPHSYVTDTHLTIGVDPPKGKGAT